MVCASSPIETPQSGRTTCRADRMAERDAAASPRRDSTRRYAHIVRKTPARSVVGIEPVTGSPVSSVSVASPRAVAAVGTARSGSGPSSTSSTVATRQAPKNHMVACSSPNTASRPAATNGPMNMPRRKVPPRSERARARNCRGTRVVMNEWRARPNAAAQKPMRSTASANAPSEGARARATTAASATTPAIAMVRRSPMRATAQPAGMLPQSCPTTSAEATRAAVARSAPSSAAITGINGMTAPSPSAKRRVGP
nr:hypothetical protein GCM10025699_31460 [Microbacterium flavescens]